MIIIKYKTMKLSQEYIVAIVIVLGALAKIIGLEIDNNIIEGIVVGVLAIWVAIRRKMRGDIDILGRKV